MRVEEQPLVCPYCNTPLCMKTTFEGSEGYEMATVTGTCQRCGLSFSRKFPMSPKDEDQKSLSYMELRIALDRPANRQRRPICYVPRSLVEEKRAACRAFDFGCPGPCKECFECLPEPRRYEYRIEQEEPQE